MRHLAVTDSLTRLNTRRWFYSQGEQLIEQAGRYQWPLSSLMLDVDDFKDVNDRYGHQVGDAVLVSISDSCRRTLRKSDLVCRYGGEEIAVLMPQTTGETALAIAERLREEVKSIRVNGLDRPVTISIGVSCRVPGQQLGFEVLLKSADDALLQAKRNGKDRVETNES